jgi:hypothetical protein
MESTMFAAGAADHIAWLQSGMKPSDWEICF